MANDQQPPRQDDAPKTSLTKGDIPALVKSVAEELGPKIDTVVVLYNVGMAATQWT